MTTWRDPLDGAPGTTVTATNGGGDPWSTVVGGEMVYVATPVWSGQAAAVGTSDATAFLLRQHQQTGRVKAVGYVRIPAPISQTLDVSLIRIYALTQAGGGVQLTGASGATPRLILQTRGSGSFTDRWTSAPLPWDAWFRIEIDLDPGTSPTTGAARLRWYLGDSTTPQGDSGWITGIDTAGADGGFGDTRHGTVAGVIIDHVGVRDGADALGDDPWPANSPPWVSIDAVQTVTAGSPWAVDTVAGDDGAIVSYVWDVQRLDHTGTTAVTVGLTGTTGSRLAGDGSTTLPGSVLQVTCTVTDDGGLTGSSSTEVRVPTSGPTTVLAGDGDGDPGWTVVGDAPSTGVALGDDDPATKARSAEVAPGSSTTRTWRLVPATPRDRVQLVAGQVAPTVPSGATVSVALVRGLTVLATATTTPTTAADVVLTVADALTTVGTDPAAWSGLSVRVTVQGL